MPVQLPILKSQFLTHTQFQKLSPKVSCKVLTSPWGKWLMGKIEGHLHFLSFVGSTPLNKFVIEIKKRFKNIENPVHEQPTNIIDFFKSQSKIPCLLKGTPFQHKVWQALSTLPSGKLITYEALAQRIHLPSSYRAVANAVGANPIAWLIPCHRVIRKDGSLGGYRWGLEVKKMLLELEGINEFKNLSR